MAKYSERELAALRTIRANNQSQSQRSLAGSLTGYAGQGYWTNGELVTVPNRTRQSLYGAIRGIDRAAAASTKTTSGRRTRRTSAV